ncbi:MAG: efflux RND transporter periplasmic adaptor subunit [Thermodesulfovibrionales bacterium]
MKTFISLFISLLFVVSGCAKPPEDKELKKSKDTIEIVFEGIILPSREEKLISPISGKILKIYAAKGKKVGANQRIVEFDKYDLEIDYKKARADYEKAKISGVYYDPEYLNNKVIINNAKERLLKTYDLYKTNQASLSELKIAEDSYMNALNSDRGIENQRYEVKKSRSGSQKDIEKARLEMVRAKYNLEHANLTSPINGFLSDMKISEGQNLSKGDLIGTVVNIDDVVVKGAISPGTYKYLKIGTSVDISCITTPPLKMKSVITEISPVVDTESGRMSIYLPAKNEDYLLQPGVKCLISKILPRKQAEQAGIKIEEGQEKADIKSNIKSPEVK